VSKKKLATEQGERQKERKKEYVNAGWRIKKRRSHPDTRCSREQKRSALQRPSEKGKKRSSNAERGGKESSGGIARRGGKNDSINGPRCRRLLKGRGGSTTRKLKTAFHKKKDALSGPLEKGGKRKEEKVVRTRKMICHVVYYLLEYRKRKNNYTKEGKKDIYSARREEKKREEKKTFLTERGKNGATIGNSSSRRQRCFSHRNKEERGIGDCDAVLQRQEKGKGRRVLGRSGKIG